MEFISYLFAVDQRKISSSVNIEPEISHKFKSHNININLPNDFLMLSKKHLLLEFNYENYERIDIRILFIFYYITVTSHFINNFSKLDFKKHI